MTKSPVRRRSRLGSAPGVMALRHLLEYTQTHATGLLGAYARYLPEDLACSSSPTSRPSATANSPPRPGPPRHGTPRQTFRPRPARQEGDHQQRLTVHSRPRRRTSPSWRCLSLSPRSGCLPRRVTGRLHSSTATADSRPDNAAPSPPKPSHPSSRSCSGLSSRSPWAGPPGALAAVLTDRREMQARHVNLVGTAWNDMGGRDRVMLSMPPRHGKSRRASRWGPLWFLRKYLRRRVLIGSYSSDLAEENGPAVTCRKIMLRSTGRHLSPAQSPV